MVDSPVPETSSEPQLGRGLGLWAPPWSQVPGPRSLVPGPRSLVPGPWSQAPGSQVPGPGSLAPGSQVPGPRSRVPGSRVPGSRVPGSRVPGPRLPGPWSQAPGSRGVMKELEDPITRMQTHSSPLIGFSQTGDLIKRLLVIKRAPRGFHLP